MKSEAVDKGATVLVSNNLENEFPGDATPPTPAQLRTESQGFRRHRCLEAAVRAGAHLWEEPLSAGLSEQCCLAEPWVSLHPAPSELQTEGRESRAAHTLSPFRCKAKSNLIRMKNAVLKP